MAANVDLMATGDATASQLIRFLGRESGSLKYRIAISSTVSGLSRGLLLATFNAAAIVAARGEFDFWLVGAFVAALIVHLITKYDSAYQGERMMRRMVQNLRLELCEKLLFSQLRFVERKGAAAVYAHISTDISQLGRSAVTLVRNIEAFIVLIFALIYLGWLSPPGLLAAVITLTLSAIVYRVQDGKAEQLLRLSRVKEDEFFKGVYDLVQGFKELKLNRAQHVSLADHLSTVSSEYRRLSVAGTARHQTSLVTSQAFLFGLVAILVFILPPLFPSASASVFQFLATVLFIIGPVEQLISSADPLTRARIALGAINDLEKDLNTGLANPEGREQAVLPFRFETIEFRDVHYAFENADEEETFGLGPINLHLQRGEVLFVRGGNGAGKTTLLKLLAGLYYPSAGSVLVDGHVIGAGDRQRYREMFTAVFSDFYLFQKLYGMEDPDPVYVDALLDELQIRHKTRLEGDRFSTVSLSSGQRKRLAYAVSRLSDRQIYVFDEFAADQDPAFRRYFYVAILPELKRQGKTVVAVTHDDRWFTAGDRLIKLDYGRIAEETLTPESV
jgi:putative ATP-binding cassette transporter